MAVVLKAASLFLSHEGLSHLPSRSPIKEGQAPGGEDPDHPRELDAHSLVRDFFGEQLRSRRTADWQEGDRRLFSPVTAAPGAPR
jgi:hypothetical protein